MSRRMHVSSLKSTKDARQGSTNGPLVVDWCLDNACPFPASVTKSQQPSGWLADYYPRQFLLANHVRHWGGISESSAEDWPIDYMPVLRPNVCGWLTHDWWVDFFLSLWSKFSLHTMNKLCLVSVAAHNVELKVTWCHLDMYYWLGERMQNIRSQQKSGHLLNGESPPELWDWGITWCYQWISCHIMA